MRYHARWVLPVTQPPLENGTVVESDGRITYVGPRANAPDGDDYELGDAVLLPGLVNTHTHLELTAMRGFLENLCFTDWIDRLRRSRNDVLTSDMLLDSARLGIAEGLEAGVTTFADTCSSGVVLHAMLQMGVRGIMYQEVFGPDPSRADVQMEALAAMLDDLAPQQTDLVTLGVSPHAPYTVSDALYEASAALAAERGLPLAMHIAESEVEDDFVKTGGGVFADLLRRRGIAAAARARSPIALLEERGMLAGGPLLIHCVRVDEQDIATMARRSCSVAHCPASNAKFGHGIAPLLPLLAAGIRVGLGSDSVASNNRMDMLDEARLAVLMHRAVARHHDAFGAAEALGLATMGGAAALGLGDRTGSLEPGKDADLAAFRLDSHRTIPAGDPYSAAVFALPGRSARLVTVKGTLLVENGRVLGADASLAARVNAAGEALKAWAGSAAAAAPSSAAAAR